MIGILMYYINLYPNHEYYRRKPISDDPEIGLWIFKLMKLVIQYSYNKDDMITELLFWMDEQKFFYHYQFGYNQATIDTDIFQSDDSKDIDYWNFYQLQIMLVIPENKITFVRLYFPDLVILLTD